MATYNGTNLRVFWNSGGGDFLIAGEGECSIVINHDPRDANTKDSGKWRTSEEGEYSAEVTVSGMVIISTTSSGGLATLYGLLTSGSPVQLSVAINDGGTIDGAEWYLYGDFWLTSLEDTGANRETRTYSATFQSTSPLTQVIPL